MSTTEEQVVKDVLGRMADEAPEPVGFDELDVLQLQEVGPAPPSARIRRPASVMIVAAIATVALVGVGALVFATGVDSPVASPPGNVLLIPTHTPDDLTLAHASMWEFRGNGIKDPERAVTTALTYLRPGETTWDDDDRFLMIDVDDRFAILQRDHFECYEGIEGEVRLESETCRRQLEESECSGLGPMREGQLDAAVCIEQAIESMRRLQENPPQGFPEANTEVDFTELTVRGKPALLVEIEDHSISVTTFEGGGVVSTVTGQLVDREAVLNVAKGLQPATAERYATLTATATN